LISIFASAGIEEAKRTKADDEVEQLSPGKITNEMKSY